MADEPKDVQDINKNPDEGGNPEETLPVQESSSPTIEELQIKLKQKEENEKGLIEQIKEERRKKQEAEALAMAHKEPEKKIEGDDVELKVHAVLQKDREEQAKKNRLSALSKFWKANPEYNPENDITGLKMESVNSAMKRLNTQNSVLEEEILKDYEDSLTLMGKKSEKIKDNSLNNLASDSPDGGNPKFDEGKGKLTPGQEKLRKEKGWTVEKYLTMKAKYPAVIL